MNKQELHDQLADTDNIKITIPDSVFLDVYGKDDTRKIQGVDCTRADILARVHGLSVSKEDADYVFIRES